MALVRCILGAVVLLLVSVWSVTANFEPGMAPEDPEVSPEPDLELDQGMAFNFNQGRQLGMNPDGGEQQLDDSKEEDCLSVAKRLELVNKNLKGDEDSVIEDGDVAFFRSHVQKRNADQCVRTGCRWPKATDEKVYAPYVIASNYTSSQVDRIQQAFDSFADKTCIHFIPRSNETDYLNIVSSSGCWSYIGRIGGAQNLSLHSNSCVYLGIIQHELLHTLGFQHEHKRSDRDHYIRVLWENIEEGRKSNFQKTDTLNLGTVYDYSSVMHYSEKAFSKNGRPTLLTCNHNVTLGEALEMSSSDIQRVNLLYCS